MDSLRSFQRAALVMVTLMAAASCDQGPRPFPGHDGAVPMLDGQVDRPGFPPKDRDADKPKDRGVDKPKPDKGPSKPCPQDMVPIQKFCMDRYEAPNKAGQQPLVMYHYLEAAAWCKARNKRLCYDDEWTLACSGASTGGTKYPYGNIHKPGVCNDNKTWKLYNQSKLNGWPSGASGPHIMTLAALFTAAAAKGTAAKVAADHVQWLYQGELSGAKAGCKSAFGVQDLCGNVEEWTTRRDGGRQYFHGNLKGRYWSEARTCQSGVKTHGDSFRFYEIGFRCCVDQVL